MKNTVLITIFLLISSVVYSAADSSQYMPLKIGNKWIYKVVYDPPGEDYTKFVKSEITGDTIINSKKYYKCSNFWGDSVTFLIRYDSLSGALIRYDSNLGCNNEWNLFNFNAQTGDTSGSCSWYDYKYSETRDTSVFSTGVRVKKYGKYTTTYYCVYSSLYNFILGIGAGYRYNSSICRIGYVTYRFLQGAYINGVKYGDTTVYPNQFSISGFVRYADNNAYVSKGYVKAVKRNQSYGNFIKLDSAGIQPNGYFVLRKVPTDTVDLMAFDDDETSPVTFVPTYYESSIEWQNAIHLYPVGNIGNLNIKVFRITNNMMIKKSISGAVYKNSLFDSYEAVKYAFLYAKSGNNFVGYAITNGEGKYKVNFLNDGAYNVICNRMGLPTLNKNIVLGPSAENINFYFGDTLLAVQGNNELPLEFSLSQNFPNPFNPVTQINFALPQESFVKLVVNDALGREIAVVVDKRLETGNYSYYYDASHLSTGIYFYTIRAGDFVDTKKMVLIK